MIKYKNKALMIIRGIIVFSLFYCSFLFQYIPFKLFNVSVEPYLNDLDLAVYLSTFADLIVILILLFIYKKDLGKEIKIFINDLKKNLDTGFACWIMGFIIMIISNIILVMVFKAEGANNENAVRSLITSSPIMMGLNVCLLAPFIEELVFRKTLKDIFSKAYLFIPISFLLFGYAHVGSMANNLVDWLYIVPYGALGGVFAYAYYKTNTVFTSMTFHMLHNTLTFILILIVL